MRVTCVSLRLHIGLNYKHTGCLCVPDSKQSCKFLINGEPTDNKIAVASKGGLRVEVTAKGKLAHSAYPHLGDSAIEKLLSGPAQLSKK